MIHFDRSRPGVMPPPSLIDPQKKRANDDNLLGQYRAVQAGQAKKITFSSRIYGSSEVKERLKLISHGKCVYCDSRNTHVDWGAVEHYRPKSVYWWLAYTWENLQFSCTRCNHKKLDNFPLKGTRATYEEPDLSREAPLLINPLEENPEELFAYDETGARPEIVPFPGSSTLTRERVMESIKYYGLNREDLRDERSAALMDLDLAIAAYQDENAGSEVKRLAAELLRFAVSDSAEYAGMTRYYLRRRGLLEFVP